MSDKERIPFSMWKTALLIGQQSFLFGYCFSALNACLTTGDDNDGSHCYDGTDDTCPPGTIYNDINLSTGENNAFSSYQRLSNQVFPSNSRFHAIHS